MHIQFNTCGKKILSKDFAGKEKFAGESWHTANWPKNFDLVSSCKYIYEGPDITCRCELDRYCV